MYVVIRARHDTAGHRVRATAYDGDPEPAAPEDEAQALVDLWTSMPEVIEELKKIVLAPDADLDAAQADPLAPNAYQGEREVRVAIGGAQLLQLRAFNLDTWLQVRAYLSRGHSNFEAGLEIEGWHYELRNLNAWMWQGSPHLQKLRDVSKEVADALDRAEGKLLADERAVDGCWLTIPEVEAVLTANGTKLPNFLK